MHAYDVAYRIRVLNGHTAGHVGLALNWIREIRQAAF